MQFSSKLGAHSGVLMFFLGPGTAFVNLTVRKKASNPVQAKRDTYFASKYLICDPYDKLLLVNTAIMPYFVMHN